MSWIVADLARMPKLRQATAADFPVIEGWRAAHVTAMIARGMTREVRGQTELSTAAWLVAVGDDDRPLAAMGFRDDPTAMVREVTDLYAESSRAGLRAGRLLGDLVEAQSDREGFELRGATDPENVDYLEHLLRRGYEVTAIKFRRVPRGERSQGGG